MIANLALGGVLLVNDPVRWLHPPLHLHPCAMR